MIREIKDFVAYVKQYPQFVYQIKVKIICAKDIEYWDFGGTRPGVITTWCAKNCHGRFRMIDSDLWAFTDSRDAVAFKLRWENSHD